MNRREIEKVIARELLDHGVTAVVFEPLARHYRAVWTNPDGTRGMTVYPVSPSDRRVLKNTRGQVRRLLRAHGLSSAQSRPMSSPRAC